jgi:hypothetical protein
MIKIEPYNYYLGIYRKCKYSLEEIKKKYKDIVVAAYTPTKYIVSKRYVILASIHFIETQYIEKWIRNPDLRFLAFILRDTQINNIIKRVEEEKDRALIILSKSEIDLGSTCTEYEIKNIERNDIDDIMELAIFRSRLERER